KVLEVGVGAGTDFLQWVRAGANAYGVDLTQEAIENVTERLNLYGLQARQIQVADSENLPYQDNFFDCVYSWGVIHHSPDMPRCLQEIIRVTKPGGSIKVMVYNRRSLFAFYRYILAGLCKGKPFRTFSDVLFHDQESIGTKAYTFKEIKKILYDLPVEIKKIQAPATSHDLLYYKSKPFQWLAYIAACLCGFNRVGWFMTLELTKK
ncbi:class I SAM-dependent methyltransferase, partial [bacterium]|nr:class I SAM-dependent methyltransferase [bacterium]